MRDSLLEVGSDIKVTVGLRGNSTSFEKAQAQGFSVADGTLGEMYEMISRADMVVLLIADSAAAKIYKKVFITMKPGTTLCLAHGFLLKHMTNVEDTWRNDINVIMVAPKGMGVSLRKLYLQGKEVNGAGINASFAVEQNLDSCAVDTALALSVGIGSPYTFQTTMMSEVNSDIFGERGILLGGVWAIVECAYNHFVAEGMDPEQAFRQSVESLTGPISKAISEHGMIGLYNSLDQLQKENFNQSFIVSYKASMPILHEIYDEVESGNEVRSVILAGERSETFPMSTIGETAMWRIGEKVRAKRSVSPQVRINGHVAGMYIGMMIAQVDLLIKKGHPRSEIANESIIEAIDSLNPFMHARGVAYMVDNCSFTARTGTRKWGPIFEKAYEIAFGVDHEHSDEGLLDAFKSHEIHSDLAVCAKLRPSVDIAVN
jgi:ketol-acid reductoisomerase